MADRDRDAVAAGEGFDMGELGGHGRCCHVVIEEDVAADMGHARLIRDTNRKIAGAILRAWIRAWLTTAQKAEPA